ncbi:MAG: glycine cleavage system protein H [Acidobacteriia bacterium]|nr:glycine cleavage system protein H [Terriglobia bacterium]
MVAIFVALMFVGFILTDAIVQKVAVWRAARALAPARATAAARDGAASWVELPEGVCLSAGHAWTLGLQEGAVRAGADSLVGRALGAVSHISFPKVGSAVREGELLFRLELDGRSLAVPSPVTGRVTSVNPRLEKQPELVAQDPYGKGWVCSVVETSPAHEDESRRFGVRAAIWLEREVARFQEFIALQMTPDLALGVTSQDGGVPTAGVLAQFDSEVWKRFEREFLQS